MIRVYNPLDEDYVVVWDRAHGAKRFRVPAKEERPLVRYIALKFVKELFEKIVNDKVTAKVIEENQKRAERGAEAMSHHREEFRFESVAFSKVMQDEAQSILATLYVGIESEFGIDNEPAEQDVEAEDFDNRTTFQKAFEEIRAKKDSGQAVSNGPVSAPDGKRVYRCTFPGCDFETETPVALHGHKRSHRKTDDVEVVDKKEQAAKKVSQ